MDIFRVSDGAFERLGVQIHDFPSLQALLKAISTLLDIPLPNLILFHSQGAQVSDEVFSDICNESAAESVRIANISANGNASANANANADDGDDHKDKDNDGRGEGREAGGEERKVIALYAFDRESFIAEPEDFVLGVEEELILAEGLVAHPSLLSHAQSPNQSPLSSLHQNSHHLFEIASRLQAQAYGLRLAGGSLREHLGRLLVVEEGEEGEGGGGSGLQGSRGNGKGRGSGGGTGSGSGSTRGWEEVLNTEVEREGRLIHTPTSSASASASATGNAQPRGSSVSPTRLAVEADVTEKNNAGGKGSINGNGDGKHWCMENDMRVISLLPIDPYFLRSTATNNNSANNNNANRASASTVGAGVGGSTVREDGVGGVGGGKKMLGDWVSEGKMRLVRDSCRKIYDDHLNRTQTHLHSLQTIQSSTAEIEASIPILINEVIGEMEGILGEGEELMRMGGVLGEGDLGLNWTSLRQIDLAMADQVVEMTNLKNHFTLNLHILLHSISAQQSAIATLTPQLQTLRDSLFATRTVAKTGFPHLERLRNMASAYGLACVELLGRKEISKALDNGAEGLIGALSGVLDMERKRRKRFEGEVLGLLPYEVDALKSKGEEVDLGPSVNLDVVLGDEQLGQCDFSREKLDGLIQRLEQTLEDPALQRFIGTSPVHTAIEKIRDHLMQMDEAVSSIRHVWLVEAETARPKAEEVDVPPVPPPRKTSGISAGLQAQNPAQTAMQQRIDALLGDVAALTERNAKLAEEASQRDVDAQAKEQNSQAAINELQRQLEAERQSRQLAHRRAESLDRRIKSDQDTVNQQVQQLQMERSQLLQGLSDARRDEEALGEKMLALQAEVESALAMVEEARLEKDRALDEQAVAAEKTLRDRLAEADGDRAVLEHQNSSLTSSLQEVKRKAEADQKALESRHARELNGLQAEMGMVKAEVREMKRKAGTQQDVHNEQKEKLESLQYEKGQQVEFGKAAIRVASAYHECVARLHSAIQSSASISGAASGMMPVTENDSGITVGEVNGSPKSLDGDASENYLQAELDTLQNYDLAAFAEAVTRTMSLVKKWQKSCKQYRDRSKNQIAFASFAKGDLALFLPTRNATAKSWAAFNISSPHYFLKPTKGIEDLMNQREWIVARITKVDEGVVGEKKSEEGQGSLWHNPYGLADGIRFHELQAEVYVPVLPKTSRRTSGSVMLDSSTVASKLAMSEKVVMQPMGPPPPPAKKDEEFNFRRLSNADIPSLNPRPKRPSSIASSNASSSKFSRGIQLGTGKTASIVGVTKDGTDTGRKGSLSTPAEAVLSGKVGSIGRSGSPLISNADSDMGLPIPGRYISNPRRPSSNNNLANPGTSVSPTTNLSMSPGSLSALRAVSGAGTGKMSVGEGALDILKRIGSKKGEGGVGVVGWQGVRMREGRLDEAICSAGSKLYSVTDSSVSRRYVYLYGLICTLGFYDTPLVMIITMTPLC